MAETVASSAALPESEAPSCGLFRTSPSFGMAFSSARAARKMADCRLILTGTVRAGRQTRNTSAGLFMTCLTPFRATR